MKASGTVPFLKTLISPYFFPAICPICWIVGNFCIYSALIPDFLEAESKVYLLKASISFKGALRFGSEVKALKNPSEHPAYISPFWLTATDHIEAGHCIV